MGIQGLLPMLKEIQVHGHISEYKGKRLAIDGYVWLHKGAFGCAEQIVKGERTTRFVDYAMHRIRLLRHYGITPFMVFDGGPLPAKKGTEASRAKSREENLAKAQALEGQKRTKEARECYTKCLDVTPELAFQLIKALRAEQVDYVVAPYEADAQLCFLERKGFVDGIITEDSDLLVFGCKRVIFKLDGSGQCVSINREQFVNVTEFPMHGWTDLQFRRMAMLSGCDYLPSIPGIGVKTAHRMLRKYKTVEKLLQSLRLEGAHVIPHDYAAQFTQAELAFIFQRVYHPGQKRLVPLNEFPDEGLKSDDEKWVGCDIAVETAQGIARGDINPETHLPIVDPWPEFRPLTRPSRALSTTAALQPTKLVAGPMDAFITRSRSTPLPLPIGKPSSGPSRLSDQHLFSHKARRGPEAGPSRPQPPVKSKFFGGAKSAVQELEDAIKAAKEEIVWEESDGPDIESQEPDLPRRPASSPGVIHDSLRSPSPTLSSPCRKGETTPFTSPAAQSRCSTPAISSPLHLDDDDVFSPTRLDARQRTRSPSSPTRATVATSQPLVEETQRDDEESVAGSDEPPDRVIETPRPVRVSKLAPLHSILVPLSSPRTDSLSIRAVVATSSDSAEEEQVVTPSMDLPRTLSRSTAPNVSSGKKRKSTSGMASRRSEENEEPANQPHDMEDVDEEDERRRQRAKIVAAGWRKKYSLDASFPTPRSTRVRQDPPVGGAKPRRDPALSPPPPRPKPLEERPPNVSEGVIAASRVAEAEETPRVGERVGRVKEDAVTPVRSPLSAFQPVRMFSSLDRFRYNGKARVQSD